MLGAVGLLALLNGLTWWRLSLDYPVGNLELFLQLSVDVLVLTVLLYYGGGSTNPFVSLYLLPLVIAAATLPRRHTWGMAALTLACYSLLMVWHVPLPTGNGHAPHDHAAMQMDHSQHQMPEPATAGDYVRHSQEWRRMTPRLHCWAMLSTPMCSACGWASSSARW